MIESWRWYRPLDSIGLPESVQTVAQGVASALHQIPYGEVWPIDAMSGDLAGRSHPGHPPIGRMRGLAELRGVVTGLNHKGTAK